MRYVEKRAGKRGVREGQFLDGGGEKW